jgi:L-idonate 5-dehydrogenase
MLAAVLHEPGKIVVETWDMPKPAPSQVLVRVRAAGICGSDLSYYFKGKTGDFVMREPFVLGHELAGEIAAVGADVKGFAPGQRVAVNPSLHCGACKFCTRGLANQCLHMRFLGSASVFPHSQGAFREYIAVAASQCVAVPADFDFTAASMAEPLAVTLHALRHLPTLLGAQVLVVGCGPIGCLLVAGARRAGAHHLTAVDLEQPALDKALEMGADATYSATDSKQIEHWQQHRGTFDVVIEASGSAAGLDTALRAALAGGTVLQVGNLPAGQSPVAVNFIMSKELRFQGSFRFGKEYVTAVEEIVSGKMNLKPLMSHRYHMKEANEAFAMARDRSKSMKVHLEFD